MNNIGMFKYPSRVSAYKHISDKCKEHNLISKWYQINDPFDESQSLLIHTILTNTNDVSSNSIPIYFIHGTGSLSCRFIDIMLRLSTKHRCIAIDIPGYGISDNPRWYNHSPDEIFRYMGLVINKRITRITGNDTKVVLVGHSIGGFFSISALHERPTLFRQGILLATPGIFPTLGKYGYYWALIFSYKFPLIWFSHWIGKIIFYPLLHYLINPLNANFLCNPYSHHVNYLSSFIQLIRKYHGIWALPKLDTILSIPVPLAFGYGQSDTIVPSHQEVVLKKLHPCVNTYVIKGGHRFIDDTDEFERIIQTEISRDAKDLRYEAGIACSNTRNIIRNICGDYTRPKYSATASLSFSISNYVKCYNDLLTLKSYQ